jgi:hypothetical protein
MGYSGETPGFLRHQLARIGIEASFPRPETVWPRHGLVDSLLYGPFVLLGALFRAGARNQDRLLALAPIAATAWVVTLLFRWLRRSGVAPRRAFGYALLAAFGTLLWPYAYIGLETTQSLFLILAGYLALTGAPSRRRSLAVAFACALAASAKSNGLFLLPALGWLVWCDARRAGSAGRRRAWLPAAAALALIAGALLLAAWSRRFGPTGGAVARTMLVDNVGTYLLQAVSFFGSVNKSIFLFAPITLLALLRVRAALRRTPAVTVFALLSLGGLVAGHALVYYWSEETWGPRYLHSAVAPLVLCAALGAPTAKRRHWPALPVILLAAAGFLVSLLGISFYYGRLHTAATLASRANLEALQHDPAFNHPLFNARLLILRFSSPLDPDDSRRYWPPPIHWWWKPPPGFAQPQVDLAAFLSPQPLLLRSTGAAVAALGLLLSAGVGLLAGLTLLLRDSTK